MCLLLIADKIHPKYKLIIAANRDEFYDRPAEEAHFWKEHPGLLAGKDLKAGGTWLGITKGGKFSALTNYRDMKNIKQDAPTRGNLTTNFLTGTLDPEKYLKSIKPEGSLYNGYNIICGDTDKIFYYSNVKNTIEEIGRGVYALSNCFLDTPWFKAEKIKQSFKEIKIEENLEERLFKILTDNETAADEMLPDTGIDIELERLLSSIFIKTPVYGTRCSTIILIDNEGSVNFTEKSYYKSGDRTVNFKFNLTSYK